MAKKVLGKGLGAIISDSVSLDALEKTLAEEKERVVLINVEKIKPNPNQPRTHIDDSAIQGLADSIQSVGLLQPILVRKEGDDYFVIAGERRLQACKIAGLREIAAIIVRASEEETLTMALIENIQRTDLDPIEEARAYQVLVNRFKLKQHEIAQRVGKDRATIANMIRLLNLPGTIQKSLSEGRMSVGHAKLLLSVSEKKREELFNEVVKKGLSVRALEKMMDSQKKKEGDKKEKRRIKHPQIKKMEDLLISILGTKVEIKHAGRGGKIEISYYSLDDFERIIEVLTER
jgi:ParB family chromosome partitioning protein